MQEFKASNGIRVEEDSTIGFHIRETVAGKEVDRLASYSHLNDDDMQALREFFLHERDQELGRWRYNDHLVVYPLGTSHQPWRTDRMVHVLDEKLCKYFERSEAGTALAADSEYTDAARAFFDAHPEPKPWHDAKPGEVWVLTRDGEEHPWGFDSRDERFVYASGETWMPQTDPGITDGRRIWPEVS